MALRLPQLALRRALRDAVRRPNSWGAAVDQAWPIMREQPAEMGSLLRDTLGPTHIVLEGLPPKNDLLWGSAPGKSRYADAMNAQMERGQLPYEMGPLPAEGRYARAQDLLAGTGQEDPRIAVQQLLGREQDLADTDPQVFAILIRLLGPERALQVLQGGGV